MIINLSKIDFGGITGGKSKPEEVFDVQPTTSDQTITPTEGSVFSGGTVRAVTSSIDVNITSNNFSTYFSRAISSYHFVPDTNGTWSANNLTVDSSTAQTTLTCVTAGYY